MVINIDTNQAMLSRFSEALRKLDPTFDCRNFGYSSFKNFCDALKPHYIVIRGDDNQTYFITESKTKRN